VKALEKERKNFTLKQGLVVCRKFTGQLLP